MIHSVRFICVLDTNTDIIDLNHEDLVLNKKNPPYDEFQVLDIFRRNGLKETADYLHTLI